MADTQRTAQELAYECKRLANRLADLSWERASNWLHSTDGDDEKRRLAIVKAGHEAEAAIDRLRDLAALASQAEPTMSDAIAAGDGTLHGAIDYWQQRASEDTARCTNRTHACGACENRIHACRAVEAEQSEDGRDAALLDALGDYLEKQDALDNREISGPNAEDYFVLVSRRNKARSFLDAAIAAKEQS